MLDRMAAAVAHTLDGLLAGKRHVLAAATPAPFGNAQFAMTAMH